jgi:hypothetical protein
MRQLEYAGRLEILPSSQATNPNRAPAIQRPGPFPSSSSAAVALFSLPSPSRNTSPAVLAPQPRAAFQHPSPAAESCQPATGSGSGSAPATATTPIKLPRPWRGPPAVSHSRRPSPPLPPDLRSAAMDLTGRCPPFLPSSDGVAQSPESWLGSDPHLRSETDERRRSGKEWSVALLDSLSRLCWLFAF